MSVRKYRWSKDYESAEEELVRMLHHKRVTAVRFSLEPGERLADQIQKTDVHLWCAESSMLVTTSGQTISLQPGDVLAIPAQDTYNLFAGINGCGWYQTTA